MKKLAIFSFVVLFQCYSFAQDSLPPHLQGKIKYPAFKFHKYMGVIDTDNTVMKYTPDLDYKVVIDIYDKIKDSTKLTGTLLTAGRTYNLNIANGVPQDDLNMAIVVHGFAVYSILNDEAYEKKYGVKNPNSEAIKAYKNAGVSIYVCGQNLGFFNLPPEDLMPEIDIAISAKTTLIALDQMGYTYMNVNSD
ncbi:MAG: DsrE family protein [Flavobacteriaceae bacterium]|nr:DsrE family protein [Flavobacteriaceae bacterium]